MRIDIDKLKDLRACSSGMDWLESLHTTDAKEVVEAGIRASRWSDLRWGISHLMTKNQCVEWAIYCAEQVISIYENRYPENDAPRKAIGAARNYLMDPSDENRRLAADAACAAVDAAACAAVAADAAADAAAAACAAVAADAAAAAAASASAAYAASYAASYAAAASASAADAAAYAAASASAAADAADAAADASSATDASYAMEEKCIWKGFEILQGKCAFTSCESLTSDDDKYCEQCDRVVRAEVDA